VKTLIQTAFVFFLFIHFPSYAASNTQEVQPPQPFTIVGSLVHMMHSEKVDEDFKIDILFPASYLSSNQQYPVVYLTDSGGYFSFVSGNLRMLQLTAEMAEVIVVGIGYQETNIPRILSLRTRDLTPTLDKEFAANAHKSPVMPLAADINPGGAGIFIQFINQELKPFINKTYRTNQDDETLMGYSFGGLFGLYVLFNHTDSFDKYVIGSPSIWFDNSVSLTYEADYAKANKDLDKRIFMSVGGLEQSDDPDNPSTMITDMKEMFAKLQSRQYPGLLIDHHVFEGETHQSGIGTALNRGLRFVFKDQMPKPPSEE
jgi:predicted alpha/beta superfamily hydrolase